MNYEQYHQKGGTYVIPVEIFDNLLDEKEELDKEKEELITFLKEEQDRLARECSPIYEDDLGKHRLVNEDIYNEVSKILSKIEKR